MASTTNTLANHYAALAPDERMSAVLEALARKDDLETQRLQDACPKRHYSAPDAHYTDRLLIALDAAAVAAIELRGLWGQLRSMRWAAAAARELIVLHHFEADLTFMQGVRAGHDQAQVGGPDNAEELDAVLSVCAAKHRPEVQERSVFSIGKLIKLLEEGARLSAADLAAAWEAYRQFCQGGPGVNPSVLLAARGLHALAGDVTAALAPYPDLRPASSKVNEYHRQIAKPWQLHFGEAEDAPQEATV